MLEYLFLTFSARLKRRTSRQIIKRFLKHKSVTVSDNEEGLQVLMKFK